MFRLPKVVASKQKSLLKSSLFKKFNFPIIKSNNNFQRGNEEFRFYCQACDATIPPGTPYEDHHLDIYLSNALEVMFTNDMHSLEILDFVLAARPNQANVLSKKAAILFGRLRYKEGVECLEKCLDSVPPDVRVYILEDVICTFMNNYFEEPYAIHLIKGIYRRHRGELDMAINEFRYALLDKTDDPYVTDLKEELLKKRELINSIHN